MTRTIRPKAPLICPKAIGACRAAMSALLFPAVLICASTAPQTRSLPTATLQEPAETEIERVEEWPELSGGAKSDVKKDVSRLRKAKTPEMGEQAEAALIGVGAAVVPYLLPSLGKESDPDALERIERVLLAVTGPEHTRVLGEYFDDRSLAVRVWSMQRAARFPDAGLREQAVARMHAVVGAPDKPARKAPDADEAHALCLLVTSAGSLEGLDGLFLATTSEWKEQSVAILAALPGVRGEEASANVVARMNGERKHDLAALRMLWGCGHESAVAEVRPFLDSEDATLRGAAINALRCIVDQAEPIAKLPVFEGIERAKKWKERLH